MPPARTRTQLVQVQGHAASDRAGIFFHVFEPPALKIILDDESDDVGLTPGYTSRRNPLGRWESPALHPPPPRGSADRNSFQYGGQSQHRSGVDVGVIVKFGMVFKERI
jgi:hypothetical protein